MIIFQLILYCAIFTLMVWYSVRKGAIDGLYFYPAAVQERAFELGLTTKEDMQKKRKVFMTAFYIVMLTALVLIIGVWNGIKDYWAAYVQALIFLEVMNWFDGIVIDKIWVGYSKFWIIPGCEDIPYVQTWSQMFKKRVFLTLIWLVGSFLVAGIVALISLI